MDASVRCIMYGKEKGEKEGTPHLQGFVVFHTKKSFKQVTKVIRGHVMVMKGRIDQNVTYCSKDGDVTVHGEIPMSQKKKGEKGKECYEEALKHARVGEFDKIDAALWTRYDKMYMREYKRHRPKPVTLDSLENEWLYGTTGTGKSRMVREKYPDAYIKSANTKWWDHYVDQEVVIIEDFDKFHVKHGYDLKIWGDHYPFPAETKGSTMMIRPKKIIITSNYTPEEIWDDETTYGPINRRFKVQRIGEAPGQYASIFNKP